MGFCASRAGRSNFGCLHRCTLVRAGRNSVGLLVVILYFYFFIGLQFRAGQSTMPCLHKALNVSSNFEMRLFILIISIFLIEKPCCASQHRALDPFHRYPMSNFAFWDTIPTSITITLKEFDKKIDECITLLQARQLRELTDSQHRQIIFCFNSLRNFTDEDYKLFKNLLQDKCYFEDILIIYPDWLPSLGLGYYFPRLKVF